MSDDLDVFIARVRLDVAERAHASAMLACSKAEIAWREAVATRAVNGALASNRYAAAERRLKDATADREQCRAALRSAELPRVVA